MSIPALIQCMNELNEIHVILLELAKRKQGVLVVNQVDQLNQIVNQENKLLRKITELDQKRVEVIGQILLQRGYRPDASVTVSDLIRLIFKAEDKKALMDSQQKLMGTINQLREVNALNQKLIEQSLAYINYTMDLVVGPPEDETVYRHPVQQNSGMKRAGMFDTKA